MASVKDRARGAQFPLMMRSKSGEIGCFGTTKHLREGFDRDFDYIYWQNQSSSARFQAAWELAYEYHKGKGMSEDELRLQRSIASFQRIRS